MQTDQTRIAELDPALGAELGTDLAPYRLLREIGRGGMSVVYEALDTRTGQHVALKVLALPFAATAARRSDLVARFRREERAVTRLSHLNIVGIKEIGERGGLHFIAMEYLPGESLRARLERGPLSLLEADRVLTQIAAALMAVHGAGIVHRDVKPSNIMLLPDGSAKLLDFGVARHPDDTAITSGGLVVGSPAYLSPEQVRGGEGTTASDVWALGVLLSEMLAGHPPFRAAEVAAVMYQVIHEPPRLLPGLPPAVGKVLKRALDKVPARRFPTAQALAEAFASALPAAASSVGASRQAAFALPRWWPWAALPLLFLVAAWGSFYGHRRASAPPPAPSAVLPPAALPPAALPVVAAVPPVVPAPVSSHPEASRVPSVPAVRPEKLAQTPPAALPRHAAPAAVRPRVVPVPLPPAPRVLAKEPVPSVPRPVAHTSPLPRPVPARVEAAAPVPPVTFAVPEPMLSPRQPPRPKPAKTDDDAEAAAQLQKFIWPEGR